MRHSSGDSQNFEFTGISLTQPDPQRNQENF